MPETLAHAVADRADDARVRLIALAGDHHRLNDETASHRFCNSPPRGSRTVPSAPIRDLVFDTGPLPKGSRYSPDPRVSPVRRLPIPPVLCTFMTLYLHEVVGPSRSVNHSLCSADRETPRRSS
jgi:hypothetical protein